MSDSEEANTGEGGDADAIAEFEDRFQTLIEFVEVSAQQVEGGNMPDLTSLDNDVSVLCQDVESADSETAKAVQPMMSNMIAKLDQLAQVLTRFQTQVQEEGSEEAS